MKKPLVSITVLVVALQACSGKPVGFQGDSASGSNMATSGDATGRAQGNRDAESGDAVGMPGDAADGNEAQIVESENIQMDASSIFEGTEATIAVPGNSNVNGNSNANGSNANGSNANGSNANGSNANGSSNNTNAGSSDANGNTSGNGNTNGSNANGSSSNTNAGSSDANSNTSGNGNTNGSNANGSSSNTNAGSMNDANGNTSSNSNTSGNSNAGSSSANVNSNASSNNNTSSNSSASSSDASSGGSSTGVTPVPVAPIPTSTPAPLSLTITVPSTSLRSGSSPMQALAKLSGQNSPASVTWTVHSNGSQNPGSIDDYGLYTAPASGGGYDVTITASLNDDPSIKASLVIKIVIPEQIFVGCQQGSEFFPITADVYQLPANTSKLPNFSTIGPKLTTVCMDQYNVAPRDWSTGFPGVTGLFEWFALRTRTHIIVPADGSYTFKLNSDDGAKLYIDGRLVIDNDGQHAPAAKDATLSLSAGDHVLAIDYFQGPRYQIALELYWKVPGSSAYIYVPKASFK